MNRFKITIGLVATILLSSCGNSVNSDAKKLAKLQCEAQEITQKMMTGDLDASDSSKMEELTKEIEEVAEKLDKEYTTEKEQEELQRIVMKEMEKCQ